MTKTITMKLTHTQAGWRIVMRAPGQKPQVYPFPSKEEAEAGMQRAIAAAKQIPAITSIEEIRKRRKAS